VKSITRYTVYIRSSDNLTVPTNRCHHTEDSEEAALMYANDQLKPNLEPGDQLVLQREFYSLLSTTPHILYTEKEPKS